MTKYTPEELNNFSKEQLISLFCTMQDQLEQVNRNLEKLIEEVRLVDQNRFGRKTEKLDQIAGQMNLFNETEAGADPNTPEPREDEVVISVAAKKKKSKGKREEDCKDLPREEHHHALTGEQLDTFFGKGRWRRMKQEVIQADETTCQVIHDNNPDDPDDKKGSLGHKNYMWVYRTGEFNKDRPIVIYDYERTRHNDHPLEFLKDFKGILETDGLQQYHILDKKIEGLTNANCWVHARRDFSDAIKVIGKQDKEKARQTTAYQALVRIAVMYKIENTLRDLTAEKRLRERQKSIAPLVDEFFAWAKERLSDTTVLPRGKTAEGLNYCLDHEKYLRVFLTNGNVPMDNSASERAIRPFTIGRKNWVVIDSVKGAQTSAVVYSIVETAKLNNLNVFCYLEHLLTEIPKLTDKEGNIDTSKLGPLLPWSDQLPQKCHKPRR